MLEAIRLTPADGAAAAAAHQAYSQVPQSSKATRLSWQAEAVAHHQVLMVVHWALALAVAPQAGKMLFPQHPVVADRKLRAVHPARAIARV